MDSTNTSNAPAYGVALLRVSLGIMWIAHALLKLLVFTLPGTAAYFASVGLPGLLAYPVFAIEIVGGAALVLGVYARQASLALVPIMAGEPITDTKIVSSSSTGFMAATLQPGMRAASIPVSIASVAR